MKMKATPRFSARKESAIYQAVTDVVMDLRIRLSKEGASASLDVRIARAGDDAGMAAVKAYRTPLTPKSSR